MENVIKYSEKTKNNNSKKYYSLDDILKIKAKYYMVYGERSSGKTYAGLSYALEQYFKYGKEFIYLRRWLEDIKNKNMSNLFSAISQNRVVIDLSGGEWEEIYYYSGRFYLSRFDEKGKREIKPEPIGYTMALTAMEHEKSVSYPNVKTIIFDEFLSRDGYLHNEFISFMNTISTVVRDREDVNIFMFANSVNFDSPYFEEMGLDIADMETGTIREYKYGDSGLKVAVERTGGAKTKKKSDVYFAFNNPKLKMITGGEWEMEVYPKLPFKYYSEDIQYSYYINWGKKWVKCDIVIVDSCTFTYIYRIDVKENENPKEREEYDIIFTTESKPDYYIRRNILKRIDKLSNVILKYFNESNVYYDSNYTGEIVRNYIIWCNGQNLI